MIKIVNGKNKSLHDLKEEYFELLNPQKNDGRYHMTNSIYGRISRFIRKRRSKNDIYYNYIIANLKELLIGEPTILLKHIRKLKKIVRNNDLNINRINLNLSFIFNYKSFRKGKIAKWLIEELNINTCPYCNRQYIFAIKENDKTKLFCDLDHYFKQSDYPVLSLSFYNLIPSCTSCNSRTKHTKVFSLKTHIHPYLDSFNDILVFSTDIKDSKIFFDDVDNFDIKLVKNKFTKPCDLNYHRAKKTAEDFNLEELYNKHKDIVLELIQKNIIYDDNYVTELYNNYYKIFENKDDVYKMIIGNYVNDTDLSLRPLAKFTKDIAKEFKLLLNY